MRNGNMYFQKPLINGKVKRKPRNWIKFSWLRMTPFGKEKPYTTVLCLQIQMFSSRFMQVTIWSTGEGENKAEHDVWLFSVEQLATGHCCPHPSHSPITAHNSSLIATFLTQIIGTGIYLLQFIFINRFELFKEKL